MTTRLSSFKSYIKLLTWSLFFTSFSFSSLNAQCPTVINSLQTFCDVESILVSDLMATDNGGGVFWYDTPTSTTPLLNFEGLVNGEDYYADDSSGNCGPRQRVDVVIFGPPIGQPFQGVCLEDSTVATIADLVVTGNDVQWYLTPSGGLPLSDTTVLVDNSFYYADQVNPNTGCRTSRLTVQVNIGFTPNPIGDAIQEFCRTPDRIPTVGDLIASGNNNWYISLFSALPLPLSTPLNNGQIYYASTVDPPCESSTRLAVLVLLTDSPDPGTSATLDLCENDNVIDLFTVLGGSPETGGTWSPALASGTGEFNPAIDLATIYTYTLVGVAPCPDTSATVTVSIIPEPDAGTDGSVEICENNGILFLFDFLQGTPQVGGTWSPALASGTDEFNPAADLAGQYTYTIAGIPPCDDAFATVTVSLISEPNAGENGAVEVCNSSDNIFLFDFLQGNPQPGGTWSPALTSGTDEFNPTIDGAGQYTYTVQGIPPCADDSAIVDVTVTISLGDAGENGSVEVCTNSDIFFLFDFLQGTPQTGGTWSPTLTSGTDEFNPEIDLAGIYTYTIAGIPPCEDATSTVEVIINLAPDAGENGSVEVCSNSNNIFLFDFLQGTPQPGGTWTPALASGTDEYNPAVDPGNIYTYTVTGSPPCLEDSATVIVALTPEPDAGEDGSLEVCTNDGILFLFDFLQGTPQPGGTWSPALSSGTDEFNPAIDLANTYTYTITGIAPCNDDSATVTVTVLPGPDAGENGSVEICSNSSNIFLFDFLQGTPQSGGTWSPALASGTDEFNPALDSADTYTYTVAGIPPCTDDSATVAVSFAPEPDAGENGSVEVCTNSGNIFLFDFLQGSPQLGGTWSPALVSGTDEFNPAVDLANTYTYTITGIAPCNDDSATVTVSVLIGPDAGEDGSVETCDNSEVLFLFDFLQGSPQSGGTWSPALASGTDEFNPAIDSANTYTYTIAGVSPCLDDSATVTISVLNGPDAGEDGAVETCDNGDILFLFDFLQGTPQLGGTWSPALTSGTDEFDPTVDSANVYTYTISGIAPCLDDSATVTVSILTSPDAGEDGSVEICEISSDTLFLFDFLQGMPQSGGTWSPALASGTDEFNPAIDASGIYTYTVIGIAPCEDDTATVSVSILPEPDAGENGVVEVCTNSDIIFLFDFLQGTPQTGGTWSPALASGTDEFDPSIDLADVYTYTIAGIAPCIDATATVTVSVLLGPNAGEDGSAEICETSTDSIFLFDFLQGTPQPGGTWSPALASGTDEFNPALDSADVYAYTVAGSALCDDDTATVSVTINPEPDAGENGFVEVCDNGAILFLFDFLQGTPQSGGTWSPALASGSDEFNPAVDSADVYTYSISGSPPCDDASATVTVTVITGPDAGEDGSVEVCINDANIFLFDFLEGTPQSGGSWSPALASGTDEFNPAVDAGDVYTYTVAGSPPCEDDVATVSVSIKPTPNAGFDSIVTLCRDDDPTDLFSFLGATADTGGVWSPALNSGTGLFDPSIDPEDTYTYTVISSECNLRDVASVTVIIREKPDVSGIVLNAELSICIGSDISVELTGGNLLVDGLYTIDYVLSGANSASNTIDINIAGGNASFIISSDLIQNSGITFITITGFYFVGESCNGDTDLIASIEIDILETPTPQIIDKGNQFCSQENPTISDLNANIIDTEPIIWYDMPEGGTPYSESDPIEDGVIYYGSIQGANGCESTIRLQVTASVTECLYELIIPDGFSPNGDGINDDFHIVNLEILYPNFKLRIYNRYGNILYEGNIDTQRWDGTSKNSDTVLPVGVYFYILEFNDGERDSIQGRVYLSR